jgi:general secretion pathway protein C
MALDQLLRRNFWVVVLILIAIAAFLDAQGVSHLIGSSIGADEKQLAAPGLVAKTAPMGANPSPRVTSADPILARNPFDHTTGPLNKPVVDESVVAPPPDLSNPKDAPPCDGVKVLVIAASSQPEWSFAALMGTGEQKSHLVRRGMEFNSKKVEFVGWDRVWLTGPALCQAELFKPAQDSKGGAAPTPAPTSAPPPSTGGGAPSLDPTIAKGIQRVSATEFNVDRGVVDKILENQADLMRQARIVPEQENGKVVGIRLFGVRPDTLLGTLGLENGDRLQTINGFDMTSPEKALEAYARLRTADKLTININRRGQNMNMDYNIK